MNKDFLDIFKIMIKDFPELDNQKQLLNTIYNSETEDFDKIFKPIINYYEDINDFGKSDLAEDFYNLLTHKQKEHKYFLVTELIHTFPEMIETIDEIDEFHELPFLDYEELITHTRKWIERENVAMLRTLGNFLEERMLDTDKGSISIGLVKLSFLEPILFADNDLIEPLLPYLHKKR